MPKFEYKALSLGGQEIAGELESPDRQSALRELASRGSSVTDIRRKDRLTLSAFRRAEDTDKIHVSPKQVAILTRQLATSLEAGLTLTNALEVMTEELDHAPSRRLLGELGQRVQEGASLSDALADHPKMFGPMYVRLVAVGETGGVLDTVLAQLADILERRCELRDRVKTASIYPAILLLVATVSVVIIVTVIVPRILAALGTEDYLLPWPTRVILAVSHFLGSYWWLILAAIAAAVVLWRRQVRHGPWRDSWDKIKLRIPLVGRLVRQIESARLARSLGILLQSGVTITEALTVACQTVQNAEMQKALHELTESVRGGESIATPLRRSGLFRPLLVRMVRVGESTGRLDDMLVRAAGIHESEVNVTLDRLVNVLPVLMILGIAVVIGFIVAGLVLAIVQFQATGAPGVGG